MIRFNSRRCPYAALSNFSTSPFELGGVPWLTVEHYYQAHKFLPHDPEYAEAIRLVAKPRLAKRMGQSRQHIVRGDWEQSKERVMLEGLRVKFAQHAGSRAVLLATGKKPLMEHAPWGDAYWGDGGDGSGLNRLGALLEEVREEITAESSAPATIPA